MTSDFLYLIEKNDIEDKNILYNIYKNKNTNYYASSDFSKEFYILLAKAGFISTSIIIENEFYLLPEIQFEYAILDFENLHINKKAKNLLNNKSYIFLINNDINSVLEKIEMYHKDNWLYGAYKDLILDLYKNPKEHFEIFCVELYDDNILVAGEIGYKINKTYTSLTGFSSKEKIYNNWGKLQLILLAKFLEEKNFSFWNLGHPYMQYKFDIGAKIYSRDEFLNRWLLDT